MFTGLIDRLGKVEAVEDRPGSRLLRVTIPRLAGRAERPLELGESIAVSGVCLTAVEAATRGGEYHAVFEVVPETLRRTTLGGLRAGAEVNIERSLAVGDLLGGHLVTGHIDGMGEVRARRAEGDQVLFEIAAPALILQVIPKGSVAVDGISLTVVGVDRKAGSFSFAAIPHTLACTTLKSRAAGSAVNLETDMIGKWVLHAVGELGNGTASRGG
jgi:riboflavin synthase